MTSSMTLPHGGPFDKEVMAALQDGALDTDSLMPVVNHLERYTYTLTGRPEQQLDVY